jgi:hypothetical protein
LFLQLILLFFVFHTLWIFGTVNIFILLSSFMSILNPLIMNAQGAQATAKDARHLPVKKRGYKKRFGRNNLNRSRSHAEEALSAAFGTPGKRPRKTIPAKTDTADYKSMQRVLRLGSKHKTKTSPPIAMKKETDTVQRQITETPTGSWRKKTNPHADANGGPKKGEEFEFFEWAEKEWDAHVKTLSPEEQEEIKAAVKNMAAKMNS